ncbi:MAG: TIGR02206 family membrane protein [Saprospiraceae bacterium]|mgnify:CR=1 FL=1|nr:TIGR02206 family membrane protein [Saprospiraceae bacterium]
MERWYDLVFGSSSGFQPFGLQHLIPILFFIIMSLIWIQWALKKEVSIQYKSAWWFSISLAIAVIWWMAFRWWNGKFDIREDLPFHLCNLLTLVFPIALYFRSRWFFGILYFWVLAGTLQAVITPDLKEQFPHFIYFRYWWIHCGLISLLFYGLIVFKWKIYFSDLKNALIGANVYLIFSLIVNGTTGGNYFFSMRKPDAATMLDYLGPWPWYLLTGQFLMALLFLLFYLPFYLTRRSAFLKSEAFTKI